MGGFPKILKYLSQKDVIGMKKATNDIALPTTKMDASPLPSLDR